MVPSRAGVAFGSAAPKIAPAVGFVAPCATVLGDVTLGAGCTVWYGATLRGDVHKITVGEGAVIGDGAVVHVAKIGGDFPTVIGARCVVGPNAIVHACTLADGSAVGAGATVLDGAKVEANAQVAPGALVGPGTVVKAGQLWAGVPAKAVRDLTADELAALGASADAHLACAKAHAVENGKDFAELEADALAWADKLERHPEYLVPDASTEGPNKQTETAEMEIGMIFNNEKQTFGANVPVPDLPAMQKGTPTSTKQQRAA